MSESGETKKKGLSRRDAVTGGAAALGALVTGTSVEASIPPLASEDLALAEAARARNQETVDVTNEMSTYQMFMSKHMSKLNHSFRDVFAENTLDVLAKGLDNLIEFRLRHGVRNALQMVADLKEDRTAWDYIADFMISQRVISSADITSRGSVARVVRFLADEAHKEMVFQKRHKKK